MNETHDEYMIKGRIESLTNVMKESSRTILQLNTIISEHITARNIEIVKKEDLQETIDKLKAELNKFKKSEEQVEEWLYYYILKAFNIRTLLIYLERIKI